jgi:MMP 1-O-methyltransferase
MPIYPTFKEQINCLSAEQKEILNKIPYLEQIDGWLLLSEAVELFSLANKIESLKPVICEIGVWKGKSSYVFASAVKEKKGVVYSIDPFNGEGDCASVDAYRDEIKKLDVTLIKNFENTLSKYGLLQYVKVLPFLSEDARKNFYESKIDFLFIDGNHDYASVSRDYELWAPLISPGGIIALHDVGARHVDGPKRVFQEKILNNQFWSNARIVGEMGAAIKN